MSYSSLKNLTEKEEIDHVILNTVDKVLLLRFGRITDATCMEVDDIVSTSSK